MDWKDIIFTMANSKQLRQNKNQHKPKNTQSKEDDKAIYKAMQQTITYLNERLADNLQEYRLTFCKSILFSDMIKIIRNKEIRQEFDYTFKDRTIKPDGGIIFLHKKQDPDFLKVVLISEVKKQGTNDQRQKEGKSKQAQGNAIERLGKNLVGIKAMLNHEPVTPFVCFGHGCDFVQNYDKNSFVMSKVSMMNEFYYLNRTYVFKKEGESNRNSFSPVSMYFREQKWEQEEMFQILKEIGETSLRYYLF